MEALKLLLDTRAGWLTLFTMAVMLAMAAYLIAMFVNRSREGRAGTRDDNRRRG